MRAAAREFAISFAAQVLVLLVVAYGDIGFDKPGRFGLDFGDLLEFAFVWFVAVCVGGFMAWRMRRFGLLLVQVVAFAAPIVWLMAH